MIVLLFLPGGTNISLNMNAARHCSSYKMQDACTTDYSGLFNEHAFLTISILSKLSSCMQGVHFIYEALWLPPKSKFALL